MHAVVLVILLLAAIAAAIHVLFFCLESLWWTRPATRARFHMSEEEAQTTRQLAFNQGFYNLFLAAGTIFGIALALSGRHHAALILIGWNCLSMLAASVVLVASSSKMLRGAVMQGFVPLLVLIGICCLHILQ